MPAVVVGGDNAVDLATAEHSQLIEQVWVFDAHRALQSSRDLDLERIGHTGRDVSPRSPGSAIGDLLPPGLVESLGDVRGSLWWVTLRTAGVVLIRPIGERRGPCQQTPPILMPEVSAAHAGSNEQERQAVRLVQRSDELIKTAWHSASVPLTSHPKRDLLDLSTRR